MVENKSNVWVTSDIFGSDADDSQSAAHLLWYADKLNIKGFICGHPRGKREGFIQAINAYESDRVQYQFSSEFPTGAHLKSITYQDGPKAANKLVAESKKHAPSNPLVILVWGSARDLAAAIRAGLKEENCICYLICSWNREQDKASHAFVKSRRALRKILCETTFRGSYVPDPQPLSNKELVLRLKNFGKLGKWFYDQSARITPKKYHIKNGDGPSVLWALTHKNYDATKESWGGKFRKVTATTWTDIEGHEQAIGAYKGARTVSKHQSRVRKAWLEKVRGMYGE